MNELATQNVEHIGCFGNVQVVTRMNQCVECATCTATPVNEYGNAYCERHRQTQ